MAKEIVMPQMGAEMEEGTIIRWTKQVGDPIARGEAIGEIETDKATVDLESYDEGFFLGAVVADGTTVPVGTVIGYLGAQGEALPAGQDRGSAPAAPEPPAPSAPAAQPVGQPAAAATDAQPPAPSREDGAAMPVAGHPSAAAPPDAPAPRPVSPDPVTANGNQPPGVGREGQRPRVSPVARALAADLGIDLVTLRGSGPDGRIMRRDVEQAAAAKPAPRTAPPSAPPSGTAAERQPEPGGAGAPAAPTPARAAAASEQAAPAAAPVSPAATPAPAGSVEPLTRMRQTIARRMAAAKREIPHYYLTMSVEMGEALAFRKSINVSLPDDARVSVNDLIVKACALALEQHPRFNMSYTDEGLRRNDAIHIGIAVALDDGLVVPAVLNCQGKSLGAIAREARDAAERARNGRLRAAELTEGTFTVSNLGMYGVETLIAIIQPGQSAILGVGTVEQRPVVRDGAVVVRDMLTIALSADHRVTDGAQGARFLASIREFLHHPGRLVL